MPALELLCHLIGINPLKLSKEENLFLEAELFYQICTELKTLLWMQFKEYFQLIKFNIEMEEIMIDANFIRCIINDILSSEAYTLPGIAFYTQTPEDIIYEVAMGHNNSPSFFLSRKLIEIHRSVRPELYKDIMNKISRLSSS